MSNIFVDMHLEKQAVNDLQWVTAKKLCRSPKEYRQRGKDYEKIY